MYLTGFADEAGSDFATQIKAMKELGWKNIEARAIGNKNLASLTDAEFDTVCAQLDEAGMKINCFGSGIANWSKSSLIEADVQASKKELLDAIPRMKKLNIPMLRGMSYKIETVCAPDAPEVEAAVIKNLTELVKICEDNGIIYAHENCMNYGGLSYQHTLKLLDKIQSPNFTLVFDTGNPDLILCRNDHVMCIKTILSHRFYHCFEHICHMIKEAVIKSTSNTAIISDLSPTCKLRNITVTKRYS